MYNIVKSTESYFLYLTYPTRPKHEIHRRYFNDPNIVDEFQDFFSWGMSSINKI